MNPNIKSEKHEYIIIGNHEQAPGLNVYVAADGRNTSRLFLINVLEDAGKYETTLAELLSLGGRGAKYFHEVFIYNNNLCISVPYYRGSGLLTGLEGGKLDGHYSKRFTILREALFMLSDLWQLPSSFLLIGSRAKNIVVDDSGQTRLNLALDQTVLEETDSQKALWRNLASLISLLFERELRAGQHRRLNLVIDKCNKGLYSSLGELIKELEVLEQGFETPDLKTASLQKWEKIKRLGKRFIWLGYVAVACFAVWFLFNFNNNTVASTANDITTIGGYSYLSGHSLDVEQVSGTSLNPSGFSAAGASLPVLADADFYLDPKTEIEFTDYVVEPEQTFASIALNAYGSEALADYICDFNGLPRDYQIRAGMVIRLPHTEQLLALLTP